MTKYILSLAASAVEMRDTTFTGSQLHIIKGAQLYLLTGLQSEISIACMEKVLCCNQLEI